MNILSKSIVLSFVCFLFSCTKKSDLTLDYGYEYFPLEVGKYWVYNIDSTIYIRHPDGSIIPEVRSSQLKEQIVGSHIDGSGNEVYKIERFDRANPSLPWTIRDVWVSHIENNQAHRVEENYRFIKMIFPIKENGIPWDGNAFIDKLTTISVGGETLQPFEYWAYEYQEVDLSRYVGGFDFDSTLTVLQVDEDNHIKRRYSKEVYAKGVGLVEKEMKIFDSQCEYIECYEGIPWEEKAEEGFILRQTIIDYN